MFIKKLQNCKEFIAGDKTILRELLHLDKDTVKCGYSLAHTIVKSGESSTPHILKTTGVHYLLEGEGIMYVGGESKEAQMGDMIYILPNAKQSIKNSGKTNLKFLCIVDPAWRPEDEIVF